MTDRDKVLKAIECRKNAHKRCGNPCEETGACKYAACVRSPDGEPYYPFYCDTEKLCNDILLLLHGGNLKDMVEVVRCRDCKWNNRYTGCNKYFLPHGGDWYCADGERR